jgi:formylmethanofuran dehydrogenase subunit B
MSRVDNVACTVCGCVCDDLRITVENNAVTHAEGACRLAEPWFRTIGASRPPAVLVDGRPASLAEGVERAATILKSARAPLVFGLSRGSTEGQRAAVALAERLGATIDTTAAVGHAHSVVALQQAGESTCTLGEVRNRADLVVFWGSDPELTHPRHLERYSVDPVGVFLPNGRADRTVVVVDTQPTATSARADLFIPVTADRDFEALWTLRALVKGETVEPDADVGAPLPLLEDLARRMKACKFGIVFFGLGLSLPTLGHRSVEALLRLVTDLNDHTRFYARRMRVTGDVSGADSVLTWQTGYPFSVNFAAGYPRYNPDEYTGPELLARGEVDACLFVGSERVSHFSSAALAHLATLPTVALEYPGAPLYDPVTVRFTTAVHGIHLPGTAYRMDEAPIPLRAFLTTDYPSDADVLALLRERIGESAETAGR